MANILHRHNELSNLVSVLPASLTNANLGWPMPPDPFRDVLGYQTGLEFNAVLSHVRFDNEAVQTISGLIPGVRFMTIFREPVSRTLSALRFYNFPKHTNNRIKKLPISMRPEPLPQDDFGRAMEAIADNLKDFFPHLLKSMTYLNSMSFDLGLAGGSWAQSEMDSYLSMNTEDFTNRAKALVDQMHVVLLVERFDESLVLLKRRMCW